jgi:nitrile hydratase accessory protein
MTSKQSDLNDRGLTESSPELRLRVLETVLIENGRIDPTVLEVLTKTFGARIEPNAGADIASLAAPDRPAAQVGGAAMLAIPKNAEGPVFREPWEAAAFALALALAERGAFSWAEWAERFGEEIVQAGPGGGQHQGATYYQYWLAVLERMVGTKGLAERPNAAR